ncbi:MAG: sigma-70 family RNA polymerase sigma factor [Myxococcales bacterium]|nr:sigma-70 family RNA polymerase sigma factor [Myxococcales bacterium]MCB9750348.1 sigma-70 family RNA polymerase sigma factor [Myxococcales bacterium]
MSEASAKADASEEDRSSARPPRSPRVGRDEAEEQRRHDQDRRDRRLVKRLKEGDERAFQELVTTYQNRIFSLTLRFMGNREEAEDLAQEVFLTVFRAIGSYRGEGRFYTWLYRIASNTCKNRLKYLKGRQHHRSIDIEDSPQAQLPSEEGGARQSLQSQIPGPEAVVRGNRLQRAIQEEIAQLDAEHRLLIVLRDIQGLSYHDIIRITGLAEGTLKSRLHRARLALKKRMDRHMR